jgi:hypothetical protein
MTSRRRPQSTGFAATTIFDADRFALLDSTRVASAPVSIARLWPPAHRIEIGARRALRPSLADGDVGETKSSGRAMLKSIEAGKPSALAGLDHFRSRNGSAGSGQTLSGPSRHGRVPRRASCSRSV